MKNNKLKYLIPAIGFLLLLIPVSISLKKDYDVYMNGSIVTVKIKKLPGTYFTKNEFMYFELNGNTYSKSISKNTRDLLQVGEEIKLKYLAGESSHFLFPEENPFIWGIFAISLFALFSMASFYYAFKK
ncbi:hypothetical protein [[Flexibacter] sp. ATCC 35208]|uniref:hypothetical protein n=1 Tax=[Flexibacter] sp. ATCC 35208 TaxID=1936242 RepID=UPI0009D27980|nr:hypothetical protein [[Flexibacter] sp. ATCC 35208]OMP74663.1 hypothetical protein BW716_34240 [[Flexibacter] sp. ATCC 35208]